MKDYIYHLSTFAGCMRTASEICQETTLETEEAGISHSFLGLSNYSNNFL